jgi:ubiquinone/menaquinone biosynthesis C-methylase UbiE
MDDPRSLSRRSFGANAERYVSSRDHQTGESLDRLLALAAPRAEWRALDIATGGGHTALAVAPHVREVVATDLTPEMLAAAEHYIRSQGVTNVSFREADACALPFGDREFDLVTCRVAPHHFADVGQFVREGARVVRPGGTVIVIDNVTPEEDAASAAINEIEKVRDPSHQRAYNESEWVAFVRDAGLVVERVEHFRKRRDLESWTGMQQVTPEVRERLRALFRALPPGANAALAPEERDGRLTFYLNEILILARSPFPPA